RLAGPGNLLSKEYPDPNESSAWCSLDERRVTWISKDQHPHSPPSATKRPLAPCGRQKKRVTSGRSPQASQCAFDVGESGRRRNLQPVREDERLRALVAPDRAV